MGNHAIIQIHHLQSYKLSKALMKEGDWSQFQLNQNRFSYVSDLLTISLQYGSTVRPTSLTIVNWPASLVSELSQVVRLGKEGELPISSRKF